METNKMKNILLFIFAILLIGSNVWWAAKSFDVAVTNTYQKDYIKNLEESLDQSFFVIKLLSSGAKIKKEKLVNHSKTFIAKNNITVLTKEGFTWVGAFGYKFNENGYLIELKRQSSVESTSNPSLNTLKLN